MPPVKHSHFRCPVCDATTEVLRTKRDSRGNLLRYRRCHGPDKHRTTTRESTCGPATVRLALLETIKIAAKSVPAIPGATDVPQNPR
jgi:transposase-like protein